MYPSGIRCTLQRILTGIRCTCTLVNQGVMLIYSKICWWTKSVVGAISIKFLTSVYPISCKHLSNQCPANIYQTSIKSGIRYIHQRIPAGIRCTCALGNRYVIIWSKFCVNIYPNMYTIYLPTYTSWYTMYVCLRESMANTHRVLTPYPTLYICPTSATSTDSHSISVQPLSNIYHTSVTKSLVTPPPHTVLR